MNATTWLSSKLNLLRNSASAAAEAPKQEDRSTRERLEATLRQKKEALSPRTLRRTLTLLQAVVDPRELDREGATYTFDTLQELKAEQPDADLYLFIGADQANAFKTWHRWQEILGLATVVVADRPIEGQGTVASQWHNAVSPDVQRLDMPSLNVSATEIRAHLAKGIHPDPKMHAWLPAAVQHYIEKHSLYR